MENVRHVGNHTAYHTEETNIHCVLVDVLAQELNMRCQVEICRALRIRVGQDLGTSVLYPQVIPFIFETGEVGLRAGHLLKMYEALPDGISRNSWEYLLHSAPVQACRTTATRLDNDGRISHKLIVISIPKKTMSSRRLDVSLA